MNAFSSTDLDALQDAGLVPVRVVVREVQRFERTVWMRPDEVAALQAQLGSVVPGVRQAASEVLAEAMVCEAQAGDPGVVVDEPLLLEVGVRVLQPDELAVLAVADEEG